MTIKFVLLNSAESSLLIICVDIAVCSDKLFEYNCIKCLNVITKIHAEDFVGTRVIYRRNFME